jgi:hypothetical protein
MDINNEQEKILTTKLLIDLQSANELYDFINSFGSSEINSVEDKESALSMAKRFVKYIGNIGLDLQSVEELTALLNKTIITLEKEIFELKK